MNPYGSRTPSLRRAVSARSDELASCSEGGIPDIPERWSWGADLDRSLELALPEDLACVVLLHHPPIDVQQPVGRLDGIQTSRPGRPSAAEMGSAEVLEKVEVPPSSCPQLPVSAQGLDPTAAMGTCKKIVYHMTCRTGQPLDLPKAAAAGSVSMHVMSRMRSDAAERSLFGGKRVEAPGRQKEWP
eukprot:584596-Rhodomonas_salina.1